MLDGPFGCGLGHDVADGGDLFGQLLGPGRGGRGLRDGGFLGLVGGGELFLGCGLGAAGVLEFRAQLADQAALLFGRALGVQCHQAFEDLFIGKIVWPAVGVEDRGVEIVV